MMKLDIKYNENEIEILEERLGTKYEKLSFADGMCYVLDTNGKYSYNECFTPTQNEFFKSQRYQLLKPNKIIKFYNFYIMCSDEEIGVWFRGQKNSNGNYEFDCCADSLEEIIDSL